MADDLTAFVAARLDEDEARAPNFHNGLCYRRRWQGGDHCDCGGPEQVLRQVEAGRVILGAYAPVARNDGPGEPEYAYGWAEGLGMAVRALAAVYRTHPYYRQEWAPAPDTIFP